MSKEILLTLAKILKVQDGLVDIQLEKISFSNEDHFVFLTDPKAIYLIREAENAKINTKELELFDHIRSTFPKDYTSCLKVLLYNQKLKVVTYTIEISDPKIDN